MTDIVDNLQQDGSRIVRLRADSPHVDFEYRLTNPTGTERHFLWKLHAALARGDREDARRLAHSLRGMAAMLSMPEVTAAAEKLERALGPEAGAGAGGPPGLHELEQAVAQVMAGLASLPAA